jgi:hypothetical protein
VLAPVRIEPQQPALPQIEAALMAHPQAAQEKAENLILRALKAAGLFRR